MKTKFMNQHPLRKTLELDDWKRIQTAFDNNDLDSITDEEASAAHDVFYDAIAGKDQTHLGVTTLQ